jgi:hypothetical protein
LETACSRSSPLSSQLRRLSRPRTTFSGAKQRAIMFALCLLRECSSNHRFARFPLSRRAPPTMLKGRVRASVPKWILSARPLAADPRLWSQCGGLQHALPKRVWALSISHQRRCRAWHSRAWLSPPRYALNLQFSHAQLILRGFLHLRMVYTCYLIISGLIC